MKTLLMLIYYVEMMKIKKKIVGKNIYIFTGKKRNYGNITKHFTEKQTTHLTQFKLSIFVI